MFACVPNPGKQSIWRQCAPSARKQSTKKLPNRPGFTHVQGWASNFTGSAVPQQRCAVLSAPGPQAMTLHRAAAAQATRQGWQRHAMPRRLTSPEPDLLLLPMTSAHSPCNRSTMYPSPPLGACAMTTKFLNNKICTFKILLSWRFP